MKSILLCFAFMAINYSSTALAQVHLPACGRILSVEPPTTTGQINISGRDHFGDTSYGFGHVEGPTPGMTKIEKHMLFLELMVNKTKVCVDYCKPVTDGCYLQLSVNQR